MKVLTLLASGRKRGNTAAALDWMEEELVAGGHEVERVNLQGARLGGCLGCFKCQASDGFECIQKDDGNAIYAKMAAADALVVAKPLYFWGFTAQIKPLIDRLICQVRGYGTPEHTSTLKGKPVALLVTSWGPVEENTETLVTVYNRTREYFLGKDAGQLLIPGCAPDTPPGEEWREPVKELARKLVG